MSEASDQSIAVFSMVRGFVRIAGELVYLMVVVPVIFRHVQKTFRRLFVVMAIVVLLSGMTLAAVPVPHVSGTKSPTLKSHDVWGTVVSVFSNVPVVRFNYFS